MLSKEEIIFNAMQRYWETKDGANDTRFQSVEELKKYMDNPDMKLFLEVMEEYANQDKWVSVKDELPPIDKADNWNKVHGVSILVFTYSDFGMRKGTYYRLSDCWTVENVSGEVKVTHWQPLPNPPKQ